ncbi:lipopolysaccharide biosynthesis protein [Belnapia sp. F-4-1]|uniref:lipopolysaccharide biosynthesis protein n=1 Tax=Belnapia sp. F-4-1 TaxID=1545443 RepID=UPI0009DCE7E9|nr:lipopolysaccharide biosynthesis protein [Belnapia sp. F-4-1]
MSRRWAVPLGGQNAQADSAFRHALENAVWLFGGKGAGALLSLVYLAIVAQTLGVATFGVFALILAFGQVIGTVVGFQSWQTVIRYGARHLADGKVGPLRFVLGFTTALDLCAGAFATVLASLGALAAGRTLGWSDQETQLAAWFGLSLLFGQRGTPTGILRLFARFDLAAWSEFTLPVTRLLGTCAAWAADGSLAGYLIAWGVAELATTVVMWATAASQLRAQGVPAGLPRIRGVADENPGILRFAVLTNLTSSIGPIWQQVPILAVGWIVGPASAGGYRIAMQLGTALTKPVTSLARALYPEMAKLTATRDAAAVRLVLVRAALLTTAIGLLAILLVAVAGELLLSLIGGPDYVFVYPIFLVLTIASAVNLSGFGLEPALVALGRPDKALVARSLASICYLVFLGVLLTMMGPIGAAWATLAANACSVMLLHTSFRRLEARLA